MYCVWPAQYWCNKPHCAHQPVGFLTCSVFPRDKCTGDTGWWQNIPPQHSIDSLVSPGSAHILNVTQLMTQYTHLVFSWSLYTAVRRTRFLCLSSLSPLSLSLWTRDGLEIYIFCTIVPEVNSAIFWNILDAGKMCPMEKITGGGVTH